ncbi:LysE family translocator [Pseudotenacibaculum sp. MALMAid0570]|uniref:LysE family translocator n=1 Tax=Pseudotenacibaculum sp. MALMAid0570 TaxID=3143938 RepID=UPI0032DF1E17
MDIEILLSFVASVAALAFSPGPDNIFVLMQSVVYGKKYGLATVVGLMTGCIIHTTLVAFGVSAVITNTPEIFYGIKILGAVYLIYLAYKVFKSSSDITMSSDNLEKKSPIQLFKVGFLMNVLNPKVTIFFLALFPGFLFSDSLSNVLQFYVLGALFILTSFVIFSAIALLGGTISERIQNNRKIGVWLKWLQIIVFIGIAIFILL